jgi:hypothetical protein
VAQDAAGKAISPIELGQDFLQQEFPAIASNGICCVQISLCLTLSARARVTTEKSFRQFQ